MPDKLKPCPFCGGTGALHSLDMCETLYAVCMKCGARTRPHDTAEQAKEHWNRRADNETVMAIESLKAQASGWQDCCRKWQYLALDLKEDIKHIFEKIKRFIEQRHLTVEALAHEGDNEDYYAGCSDAYLRVGAYIAELQETLKEREQ